MLEEVREYCLSLPHVTEKIQWENHLLFCIGGKMFAILSLEAGAPHLLSLKSTPEDFADLTSQPGLVPAPYLARGHWVALTRYDALAPAELRARLSAAYEIIRAKLPKKARQTLV